MAERFADFYEALDRLYIQGNISGRLKFIEEWPVAAPLIMGDVLITYDVEGAEDREHRAQLEQDAEQRRNEMLSALADIEEKSLDKGALQIDYVRGIIEKYGRDLALVIYAERIVDKIIPPAPEAPPEEIDPEPESESESKVETEAASELAVRADPPMPPPPGPRPIEPEAEEPEPKIEEDPLDKVKPISVEPQKLPEPEQEKARDKKQSWKVYKIDESKKKG